MSENIDHECLIPTQIKLARKRIDSEKMLNFENFLREEIKKVNFEAFVAGPCFLCLRKIHLSSIPLKLQTALKVKYRGMSKVEMSKHLKNINNVLSDKFFHWKNEVKNYLKPKPTYEVLFQKSYSQNESAFRLKRMTKSYQFQIFKMNQKDKQFYPIYNKYIASHKSLKAVIISNMLRKITEFELENASIHLSRYESQREEIFENSPALQTDLKLLSPKMNEISENNQVRISEGFSKFDSNFIQSEQETKIGAMKEFENLGNDSFNEIGHVKEFESSIASTFKKLKIYMEEKTKPVKIEKSGFKKNKNVIDEMVNLQNAVSQEKNALKRATPNLIQSIFKKHTLILSDRSKNSYFSKDTTRILTSVKSPERCLQKKRQNDVFYPNNKVNSIHLKLNGLTLVQIKQKNVNIEPFVKGLLNRSKSPDNKTSFNRLINNFKSFEAKESQNERHLSTSNGKIKNGKSSERNLGKGFLQELKSSLLHKERDLKTNQPYFSTQLRTNQQEKIEKANFINYLPHLMKARSLQNISFDKNVSLSKNGIDYEDINIFPRFVKNNERVDIYAEKKKIPEYVKIVKSVNNFENKERETSQKFKQIAKNETFKCKSKFFKTQNNLSSLQSDFEKMKRNFLRFKGFEKSFTKRENLREVKSVDFFKSMDQTCDYLKEDRKNHHLINYRKNGIESGKEKKYEMSKNEKNEASKCHKLSTGMQFVFKRKKLIVESNLFVKNFHKKCPENDKKLKIDNLKRENFFNGFEKKNEVLKQSVTEQIRTMNEFADKQIGRIHSFRLNSPTHLFKKKELGCFKTKDDKKEKVRMKNEH